MKAQLCPKCNGQGFSFRPPYVDGNSETYTTDGRIYTCNLCRGQMIIYVPENISDPINKDWDTPEEDEAWKNL